MSEPQEHSVKDRLRQLQVDRSVIYAVGSRAWQFLSGPLTMWLIAKHFSLPLQGFFYTFGSILAMQLFFELGLGTVLINLVSHEWASLSRSHDGTVEGNAEAKDRLSTLNHITSRWYLVCAVLFVVGTGWSGVWLFSEKQSPISWQWPWWTVVVLTAASLRYLPKIAMLEACGQIRQVNQNRFLQAIAGSIAVWGAILLDLSLWTCVASAAVKLIAEIVLVEFRYRAMFQSLSGQSHSSFDWWGEAWPLQWRIAIQSAALWFANYLSTPVMWKYHSEAEAGRMGMTMQIVTAIQAGALAWFQTRVPTFGTLIAAKEFSSLDQLFRKITFVTTASILLVGTCVLGGLEFLLAWFPDFADRFQPTGVTALLIAAVAVNHVILCEGLYIRAHKKDPFLVLGTTIYLLTGTSVWYFGKEYGALGVAIAWLSVTALVYLPLNSRVWFLERKKLTRDVRPN